MSSLKQEFLRRWIRGLRKYSSKKKDMNLLERKKVIKLSADLAMASTRDKTTHWSRALIANASRDSGGGGDKGLPEHRLTCSPQNNISSPPCRRHRMRSRKILIRRNRTARRGKEKVTASFIAKRLVQKRTRRLKSLLPGGEFMDDVSLVEETLDYIQSLRAQVEVMRCLVSASELIKNPP